MMAGTLAEPTLESVETVLREELAQGDGMLATATPILRHLLVNDDQALFSDEVPVIWVLLIAAVLSSVLSIRFLARPREALALKVEERAQRASAKFEEMRSKEDQD